MSDQMPNLDPNVVECVPGAVAKQYGLIPVAQKGDRVIVVCSRPLSDDEKANLEFVANRANFEFVTDPGEYPDVRANLDDLLKRHFPPPQQSVMSSVSFENPEFPSNRR